MMPNILNQGKWVGVVTANSARASSSGEYWREGGTQQLGWNISTGDNKKQDLCKFWRSTQHKKTLKFLRNYRQAHCIVVRMALKLCVYNSRTSGQFSEAHQSHHLSGPQCTKQLADWNAHCSTQRFGIVSTKPDLRLWKLWICELTKSSIWKWFWIFGCFLTDTVKTITVC